MSGMVFEFVAAKVKDLVQTCKEVEFLNWLADNTSVVQNYASAIPCMSRLQYTWTFTIKYLALYPLVIGILAPFERFRSVYNLINPLRRVLGFAKVLRPGDTAIQAGVCLDPRNTSDLLFQARVVGPSGTVIGIEPDLDNVRKIRALLSCSPFKARIIIVHKATYSGRGMAAMFRGHTSGANRLTNIPDSENWMHSDEHFRSDTADVETDTIDDILHEYAISAEDVRYVNLTVNGAEFETLKGMRTLLEKCRSLIVTAIAGRQNEGHESGDIGFIDGRPDNEVIREFLSTRGFETGFWRFQHDRYGYVVASKGTNRSFL